MALTKTLKPSKTTTTSIIKTRAQSRTAGTTACTGRNDRTIDSVDPVAITTGRTIDVAAPAPADLFANRPKTGALKDPPVPRDRALDSDSDADAKKPAAKPKPKGRPKKVVAPKATTRKPCKPRVDANELVDPMSRVQVHDATGVVTASGGLARAGGNDPVLADPVLANPEQLKPEQPEPQPKKTRRTTHASRRPR